MKARRVLWLWPAFVFHVFFAGAGAEPFPVAASLELNGQGATQLVVQVEVPRGYSLYAGQFRVEIQKPARIIPLSLPAPKSEKDPLTGEQKLVYTRSFAAVYLIENSPKDIVGVNIHLQGCDQNTCFLPVTKELQLKIKSNPELWKGKVISKLALKPTPPVGLPAVLPAHIAARSAAGGRTALQAGHPSQGGELTASAATGYDPLPRRGGVSRGGSETSFETGSGKKKDDDLAEDGRADWLRDVNRNYKIAAIQSGYMDARSFLAFLDLSDKHGAALSPIQKTWQVGRLWISVLLMILGGLALNLTPCVLPLIPVNLAIIGAGVRAVSVRRGFLLGTLYGIGIVLAYGALGLVTVLTGAQFGALNASPWFNLVVALVFMALGMALLDVIMIDFSRFQSRLQLKGQGLFFILILGAVSALLAGACVAPVVIAVLLLAADLYLKGQMIGLLMPFLLGVGMALPWPFAGAGLSFLPKPGKWMTHIKHIFAVIILLTAFYYFFLGAKLLYARYNAPADSRSGQVEPGWLSIPEGLAAAGREKRPILVYFGASWCKNCHVMNAVTFKDPNVRKKMEGFICVKYEAENMQDDSTRAILREFGVLGLPTFVILKPNE